MTAIGTRALLLLGLRLLMGVAFAYAGAAKAIDPQHFADSIATFQLLPRSMISIVALVLPFLEIVVGTALIIGWQLRLIAPLVFAMIAVFSLAILSAIARGIQVECGCFGEGTPAPWSNWYALGRNALLASASRILWVKHSHRSQRSPQE